MEKLFILDPGHGGIINGYPQTAGKRSPFDDLPFYEGEFNRAIVKRIMKWAYLFGVTAFNLVDTEEDVFLAERVSIANRLYDKYGSLCVYVSIHVNAGGGHGIEVWTSPGDTPADPLATVFLEKMHKAFPEARKRTDMQDGDVDKEAGFHVLKNTKMPAILTENFFMDNREELTRYLLDEEARDKVAMAHLAAMVAINQNGG